MKHLTLISSSLILFLIIACTEKNSNKTLPVNTIYVNVDSIKTIKYTDLFELKNLFFFDTTILISRIESVKEINDKLIIKYRSDGYGLLLKNITTGFIKVIGKRGKGPGEYLTVTDFAIDKKDSMIWLLDGQSGKILKYDLKGDLKNEIKCEYLRFSQSFQIFDKTKVAVYYGTSLYGTENYRLLTIDIKSNNILQRYFKIPQNQAKFMFFIEHSNFSNTGLLHYKFNRSFYDITSTGIEKDITIDFGNKNLPDNVLKANYADIRVFVEHCKKTPFAYGISNVFEMQNSLYFNFEYKSKFITCIYFKDSGKYILYNKFVNDVFGLGETEKTTYKDFPQGSNDETLFFVIEPIDVKSRLEEIRNTFSKKAWENIYSKNKKWVDIFDSLSIDSNPVLVQVQIKNN